MTDPALPPRRRPGLPRIIWPLLLASVLVAAGAVWFWHDHLLTRLVRTGLEAALPEAGFTLEQVEVSGGLGRPLMVRDLRLGPPPGAPPSNRTRLHFETITVTPAGLWEILTGKPRWTNRLTWRIGQAILDYRSESFPPPRPLNALTPRQEEQLFPWIQRLLPLRLEGKVDQLIILADDQVYRVDGLELEVQEGKIGRIAMQSGQLEVANWKKTLGPAQGSSIWKNGVFYALELPLGEELHLTELEFELLRRGGPGLRAECAAFGGWLRVDAAFPIEDRRQALEISSWGRRLELARAATWAGSQEELLGEIVELRVTYRGFPEVWAKGEAIAILRADQVDWEGRGFDSLSLGLRLTNARLVLSEFNLRQKGNEIFAEGAIQIPENGQWIQAEVTGKLQANLPDLAALSALTGADLTPAKGSLNLEAEASARSGKPTARVKVRGESLQWQGVNLGDLGADILLQNREVEIREAWLKGPSLTAETSATLQLNQPHVYAGALHLKIPQMADLIPLWPLASSLPPFQGGINLEWRGDGTRESHSGAFTLGLVNLATPELPAGLSGNFTGTYSPDNLYLSQASLTQRDWKLSCTLSAGKTGLHAAEILLQAQREILLSGEIYLPWNPLLLLHGQPWQQGLLPDRPLYTDLRSSELSLERLGLLAGQKLPVTGRGRISLSGSGPLDHPKLEGSATWNDLRTTSPDRQTIAREIQIKLMAENGRATCSGRALLPLVQPITWNFQAPFGLRVADSELHWIDPDGALEGTLVLPPTPLTAFNPLLPPIRRLEGQLDAEIRLEGTLASPAARGLLRLQKANFQLDRASPTVENFQLHCHFEGQEFRLEQTGGTIGAGPFEISGGGQFNDPATPRFDLRFTADNLLLLRDRNLRLRADADLKLSGTLQAASLQGRIGLVDGRIFQKLEITPLLQAASNDATPVPLLPDLEGLVPPPAAAWALDLTIENDTPFLLVGNLASGEIIPEIRLSGTLGQPRPSGMVTLKNLEAYLPFSVVTIPEGKIFLDPLNPRVPLLDIRGTSQVLDYQITLLAQGPLDEGNLFIRSDPPLSQEAIILLLTTGLAPGLQSGSGFGEAAIGQGGLLLLKTFLRQFETEGVDTTSVINRIQITTQPGLVPGQRATMRGEFRLTDQLGIMAQRDGFGFLGAGFTYTIRFR